MPPETWPQLTSLCSSCGQTVLPEQSSCPWCGVFLPHQALAVDLPDCLHASRVNLPALRQSRLPITETTYLALGGGLGSFAWVDYLRVCGVSPEQIAVIGNEATPYGRFQRLCRHSQIFDAERIRSDSGAMPDNLWGWPGYAVQEIISLWRQKQWSAGGRIAWQIFSETALVDSYAPRAQAVFAGLEREMKRIGWRQMFRRGELCTIRQTDDGRYVVLYTPGGGRSGRPPQCLIAPYLHLALGYPGIHLAAETRAYRGSSHDCRLVAQAYENHEHIYRQLAQQGGTLILRGRGIVACRILQRLDEIRRTTGQPIQVIHLLRTPRTADTFYGRARRHTRHHWQWQPFNWPKAAVGGDLRVILEKAAPEEREALLAGWGGSTTSSRQAWQEIVARGRRQGWYRFCFGEIEQIRQNGRNRLILYICEQAPPQLYTRLVADFMLECTGLDTRPAAHPLLADLKERYRLPQNANGRFVTTPDFELKALRNGGGQVFMAGTMAFGNAFAPVDSFLGLQLAAQRSIDALIRENAPGLRRLNGLESWRQWRRWWRGLDPTGPR